MIFITLMCKIPTSPVKKNTLVNANTIKYITPNGIDGSGTLIFLGNGDYLVADESIQEVRKRIDDVVKITRFVMRAYDAVRDSEV